MIFKDLIHKTKKILSITLTLVMVLGFLPANAVKGAPSIFYIESNKDQLVDVNYESYIPTTIAKYACSVDDKNGSISSAHNINIGNKKTKPAQIVLHEGEDVNITLTGSGAWAVGGKNARYYVSFEKSGLYQDGNEASIEPSTVTYPGEDAVMMKNPDINNHYPTTPAGYTQYTKFENGMKKETRISFKVRGKIAGVKTVYVYRIGGSKGGKKSRYNVTSIPIKVISRPIPTDKDISCKLDSAYATEIKSINLRPRIKDEEASAAAGEPIYSQEAQKMLVNVSAVNSDGNSIAIGSDSFDVSFVGADKDKFVAIPTSENGTQYTITENENYTETAFTNDGKNWLKIKYKTWDEAFANMGYSTAINEEAGDSNGVNQRGWSYDADKKQLFYEVIRYIPIKFTNNYADFGGPKFYLVKQPYNSKNASTAEITGRDICLANRIDRVYDSYDSIRVDNGYKIVKIKVEDKYDESGNKAVFAEIAPKYLIRRQLKTGSVPEDLELDKSEVYDKDGNFILDDKYTYYLLREQGTVILQKNYNYKYTGNLNIAATVWVASNDGSDVGEYNFNLSIPHPIYKAKDSTMRLTIAGESKQSAPISIEGVTSLDNFINNKDITTKLIYDKISDKNDADSITYTVKNGDKTTNVCSVDAEGNVTAIQPGEATIEVKLPRTRMFSDRIPADIGPYNAAWKENGSYAWLCVNKKGKIKKVKDKNLINDTADGKFVEYPVKDLSTIANYPKEYTLVKFIEPVANVKVLVSQIATGIEFANGSYVNDGEGYKLAVGEKQTFLPTIYPTGDDYNVSNALYWDIAEGGDSSVASVNSQTGEVTAKKVGETKIRAKTKDGSNLSATYTLVVTAPSPTNVTMKNKADGVAISWDEVRGASGYTVYRSETKNGSYKALKDSEGIEGTSYTDKTAIFDKTYYYKLTTTAKAGNDYESRLSAPYSHKYEVATPTIDSVKLSGSSATITITGTKFKGYVLYYGTSEKASNMIGTTTSKETTINLKEISDFVSGGKLKGGTYYFRAKAYATKENDDGDAKNYYSGYSNSVKLTIQSSNSGGTVAPITVNKNGSLTVKVTAKKVNSAKKYQIRFYKTKKNAKKNKKAVVKKTSKKRKFKINISKKTLKKKKLTKAKKLYYRIRAKRGKKWKKWSKVKSVKIK